MKRIFHLLLFISTAAYSQSVNTTVKREQTNIYNDAVKHYMLFISGNNNLTFDTLLVLEDANITDSLLENIQNSKVIILDSAEISYRLKSDKSFIAHKVLPLGFDRGKFFINIIPFRIFNRAGKIVLENSGGCIIRYLYDNKRKGFIFFNSACSGI
jgi:hypothetical protein